MSQVNDSDKHLLDLARTGDRAALHSLISRHQAQVYRFSLRMCRNPADASDVLQDTLIALARSVRELRGQASLSARLYTVARSYCIKKRRTPKSAHRHVESLETGTGAAADVADPRALPDDLVAAKEIDAALTAALYRLSDEHREVILLRDGEGLDASEVAEVLHVSVDAVKSRLHRARTALRDELLPLLGERAPIRREAADTCPDVLTMYSQHLEGEIDAAVCRDMEQHLTQCRHCTDDLRFAEEVAGDMPHRVANGTGRGTTLVRHAVRDALAGLR